VNPNFNDVFNGVVINDRYPPDEANRAWNQLLQNGVTPEYFQQDDFTVVILTLKDHKFIGVTKRNPIDRRNPFRGKALALARAIRHYLEVCYTQAD
jgi:hypothetical protein